MPVTYLELENFKSYSGVQRIGPFKDFTSVIGPNGAGKSNLMDAISFVFGVKSRDLRSSQMKDLIFRPPGKSPKNQRLGASAALIYEDPTTGEETRFSRSISPNGTGEYRVDHKPVKFEEYEERLGEIGVILKARNFLVFQGDVESIARKSPKELVEMLEQISSSAELKEAYEEAFKAKEEAEAATIFAYNKQKGYKSERRLLKDQKEEAERFHQVLEKKAQLQTDMYLWLLFHIDSDMQEREDAVEELRAELTGFEDREQENTQVLRNAKKSASAARRETGAADKRRIKLAGEVDKLEPSIIQTTEEIKNLTKKLQTHEKQLVKTEKEAESHDQTLTALEKEISEYKETLSQLEADYEEVKRSATGPDQVTLTEEQEAEYERVREAAAAASDKPRRVLTSLNRKLESARAKAANLAHEHGEIKARRDEAARDVRDFAERKDKLSNVSLGGWKGGICFSLSILGLT
jgi:structural maintenance of chromosome 1